MTAQEKFDKAKQRVLLDHRFFASMMMRMKWQADTSCKTAWTNGKVVGYNPEYIDLQTVKQTMGIIIHEIFHPMMKHHLRIGNKDAATWNEACDYAINPLILKYGFELPKGHLFEKKFDGMSAEQIYPILMQEKLEQKKEKNKAGQDQSENNKEGQGNQSNVAGDSFRDEIRPAVNEAGSLADEAECIAQGIAIDIATTQAKKFAEKAGQRFAGMERLVKEIATTETPWEQILQRFLYDSAKTEYDWSRPSRRHEQYFPSLHNYEAGNIVIVIDSSGSINQQVFDRFMSEVSSVLENISSEIWIIIADDKVQDARQVRADELQSIKPKGYGWTNFKPAFKWLADNDIQPNALIYLTDLECNSFSDEPNFPVLWAGYGWYAEKAKVPFGEKIILK